MKSTLALAFVLAAVVAFCDSSALRTSSRASLIAGNFVTGDRSLFSAYFSKYAIANAIQYQDVIWRGNSTNRVTFVRATEVGASQLASAWIINGGIGQNNVTVRFQSQRGRGYYYLLEIWGR